MSLNQISIVSVAVALKRTADEMATLNTFADGSIRHAILSYCMLNTLKRLRLALVRPDVSP